MMALPTKIQPLVRRAVQSQGVRPMTVLSKQSGEEYKKLVSYESSELVRRKRKSQPHLPYSSRACFRITPNA